MVETNQISKPIKLLDTAHLVIHVGWAVVETNQISKPIKLLDTAHQGLIPIEPATNLGLANNLGLWPRYANSTKPAKTDSPLTVAGLSNSSTSTPGR
ncbi:MULTISPECIES: hypothetical protein [Moorena]|uniref:hypothetical protein n=1 Tax=Moorena sp. SIO4G3 TaxID=2607821 RepID=UPI001E43E7B6|nr:MULTISPECIES: hypothetical protein [Moorena]